MDAKKYFEIKAIDIPKLQNEIPELLKVIDDLYPLRKSRIETGQYIDNWRKTKYKEYLENGEYNYYPDMTIHDWFIDWLLGYFRKLYDEKTGKTIGYAYALDKLTVYFNQQIINNRIIAEIVNRPNTNMLDVLEAIEEEIILHQTINKQEAEQEILSEQKLLSDKDKSNTDEAKKQRQINVNKLKPYFISSFKGMGNGNLNYFDTMIDELKTDRMPKQFAQIALMIYESNKMSDRKPNTFSAWYNIFSECVGCDKRTYKPSQLKHIPNNLTKLFNFLT